MANKVERDLTQECEIARGPAITHTAVILAESDVQYQMQRVLNQPVRADRRAEGGRVIGATRQEIADLALDLVCAIDAADGLDSQHGTQPGPRAQSLQGRGLGAGEHPAANQVLIERNRSAVVLCQPCSAVFRADLLRRGMAG